MTVADYAFYAFAVVTVAAGLMVTVSRNPVHSVLWLILAFLSSAGLFVLLGAEFVAMLLIIVYVGAVAVLFLFVVMMLNIDFAELRAGFMRNMPLGLLIGVVLACELVLGLGAYQAGGIALGKPASETGAVLANVPNIQAIGALLYTKYIFLFEAAGLILLVAMVGAIVLTNRRRGGVRAQKVAKQNARRPQDAVVNMQPEVGKGVEL